MGRIPNDADFARADGLTKEQFRGLDQVCAIVMQHFGGICPLHNVYILAYWQSGFDFRAYVFSKEDKDVEACKTSGSVDDLMQFIHEGLERAGRGNNEDTTVAFEFDSDERVTGDFEGDCNLRLH